MSADLRLNRRAVLGALLAAPAAAEAARAQGFAGLGGESQGFAQVVPGVTLEFPRDLGPHPDFRIEWWYVTANLADASGRRFGAQWTLFRQAMRPGPQREGWDDPHIWMGHAAVTAATLHRFAERFARGGVGQAGAEAAPFRAFIDSWRMETADGFAPERIAPLTVTADSADFAYELKLDAARPLVLEGEGGYSRKSERGQASYYFSQPYLTASGRLLLDGAAIDVTGQAWLDREWSSQPLQSDQSGWDWFSLHLETGAKVMLFRLRQRGGGFFFAGNWIGVDGRSEALPADAISLTPTAFTTVAGRSVPTSWRIAVAGRGLAVATIPLNPQSWMATHFAYWEGPITVTGSHAGVGYLEMTGY